jgi:hypothetical protein
VWFIPKGLRRPSQAPPVSSSEDDDAHGNEDEDVHDSEEDVCDREEDHWHVNKDEMNQQYRYSRSPMLDTIDKLIDPTKCRILDGTGNNVDLALANLFPFQKTSYIVPVQYEYVVVQPTYVGQYGSLPFACTS